MLAQTAETDQDDLPIFPPPRDRSRPFDPPPALLRLLAETPVSRIRNYDGTVAWLITRYDHTRQVFGDTRFSSDSSKPGYPEKNAGFKETIGKDRNLRTMDPPEHTHHKRMVVRDFTVKRVTELRPMIAARVDELIDAMIARGQPGELVRDLAFPVPTKVICELLGIPYEHQEFFGSRANVCFSSRVTPAEAAQAGKELFDFTDSLLDEKAKAPGDDLLSRLVVEQLEPGHLSRKDVVDLVRFLLIAGHETTANTIAMTTLALLLNPDQYALLRADPEGLIVNAVDELVRYTSTPHLGRRRVATADIEVGGVLIRAGEGVIIANNVADRDPEVFPAPHRLDLTRPNARANLSFGFGPHQCLGQLLSRVELQLTHSALCRKLPGLRLAVPVQEIGFHEHDAVYGLASLPVAW